MGPQWGRNASVAANTVNKERAGRAALVNSLNVAQFLQTSRRAHLKSAQCRFESDWGTGYHLVDPLYGASRSVDDFLVAA